MTAAMAYTHNSIQVNLCELAPKLKTRGSAFSIQISTILTRNIFKILVYKKYKEKPIPTV